mmetsp:Transcript_12337/g.26013  ORF Transcript_12337/g.26013 Transcript_12337/m.26013 type:complete len:227 (+) Transcript_12337:121-801(+)|eukprot:CAMPEP_0168284490 /NCGR_PEP_ID=MMETSP0141_2-20121125/23534_1 /TAXON_ID=44445 /ORGANISM="Pseudo-nitzschia australis, Strain 10249 10 AB" /LENGTH=226 /DNA_ID=CAMNT_0008228497 /DNA_START=55 /DNA_END=735 /DNA_ORIENTATION=-
MNSCYLRTKIPVALVVLAISCCSVMGFSPVNHSNRISTTSTTPQVSSTPTCLYAGGFGGGGMGKKSGGDKKNKKKNANKETKLKPKQQWDRYGDFKREPKIHVAVRIKEDDSEEWLEVGRIKSKDNKFTEAAVFRQRAIIAEHAKRLYPVQLSSKKTLEWGYKSSDDDDKEDIEWKAVDKSSMSEVEEVEGFEKLVGFEGRPDPATGFYCVYDGGRLKLGEETSFG